ncbi:MAG: TIM barrel protein [Planctomycetota bacterium]
MAELSIALRVDAIPVRQVSKFNLRRSLELAASMGCQGVELCGRTVLPISELSDTAVRALRKMLDDLNLRVVSLRFQTTHGYDHVPGLDQRLEATKLAMKAAYRLGAPTVVNQIGPVPELPSRPPAAPQAVLDASTLSSLVSPDAAPPDDDVVRRILAAGSESPPLDSGEMAEQQRWNTMQSVLEDLGRYGAKVGAFFAAETGTESGPTLARLLRASDEAFLMAALNPGQLIINRHSVSEAIAALRDRISVVSAIDGVLDLAEGRGLTVPLGQGIADFPNLIGQLEEIPYRGSFVVGRANMEPETAVDELRQSTAYLANM